MCASVCCGAHAAAAPPALHTRNPRRTGGKKMASRMAQSLFSLEESRSKGCNQRANTHVLSTLADPLLQACAREAESAAAAACEEVHTALLPSPGNVDTARYTYTQS